MREVSVAERSRWLQEVLASFRLARLGSASMLPHRADTAEGRSDRAVRRTSALSPGAM